MRKAKKVLRKKSVRSPKAKHRKVVKAIKKPKVAHVPVVNVVPEPAAPVVKQRRKRGTNTTRMYFTQETEDAIVAYNKEENRDIRERLFEEKILFPFQKLVENIFNTFKFSYFKTSPQDVQKECLTHLVANMHKFDPLRTSKLNPNQKATAFAYFSIIAKHYLILINNGNWKEWNQNMEISEEKDENTIQLQQEDTYYAEQEMAEFIKLVIEFWEKNASKIFTKQRDLNIALAVVELIRSSKNISMFNKKALYLYIREMAMCKTQQITKVINRMKQYQDNISREYIENGSINTDRTSAF